MRALIQRVSWARVRIEGRVAGDIAHGLLVLLGIGKGDTIDDAVRLSRKIAELRIFADANGKMNQALLDIGGGCLVVSQFTLFADCTQGRRPFFGNAETPDLARPMCDVFVDALRNLGVAHVATGEFGAHMAVESCNDGPVTIWLDTQAL